MIIDPKKQSEEIGSRVSEEVDNKYAKGQIEHGGNFFIKPTVKNIRDEVLDLVAYTHVLADHKTQLVTKLRELQQQMANDKDNNYLYDIKAIITLAENL